MLSLSVLTNRRGAVPARRAIQSVVRRADVPHRWSVAANKSWLSLWRPDEMTAAADKEFISIWTRPWCIRARWLASGGCTLEEKGDTWTSILYSK